MARPASGSEEAEFPSASTSELGGEEISGRQAISSTNEAGEDAGLEAWLSRDADKFRTFTKPNNWLGGEVVEFVTGGYMQPGLTNFLIKAVPYESIF